jgi:hypothetical protein
MIGNKKGIPSCRFNFFIFARAVSTCRENFVQTREDDALSRSFVMRINFFRKKQCAPIRAKIIVNKLHRPRTFFPGNPSDEAVGCSFITLVASYDLDEEEAKKNIFTAIEKMKEKLNSNDEDRVSVPQFLKAMRHFVDFLVECKEFEAAKTQLRGCYLTKFYSIRFYFLSIIFFSRS